MAGKVVLLGVIVVLLTTLVRLSALHNHTFRLTSISATKNAFSCPTPHSIAPHLKVKNTSSGIVISLLFNESPEWLHYWLEQAARAIDIPYCVIVATSSTADMSKLEAVARRNALDNGGCVILSPPVNRKKYGYDLLRAHMTNLRVAFNCSLPAFAHSSFTHILLMASNVAFIRKVTSEWISAVVKNGPHLSLSNETSFATPQEFEQGSRWTYARAVAEDELFWRALKTYHQDGLAATISQSEGIFGERIWFEALLNELTSKSAPWARLIAAERSGFVRSEYPAEEIILPTVMNALGILGHFVLVVRVFWERKHLIPTERDIFETKAQNMYFGVKRIPRDPLNSLTKYCLELASEV